MIKHHKSITNKTTGLFLLAILLFTACETNQKNETNAMRLWYTESASEANQGRWNATNVWQRASLPIGNGDLGANVYGDVETERLVFNEKTLWTGGPAKNRPNYNGGNLIEKGKNGETLRSIQQLFSAGKNKAASKGCAELTGSKEGYGAYQAWGDIYFAHTQLKQEAGDTTQKVSKYMRDLNLETATASVSFIQGNTHYTREFFVSNPADVLVAKFEADGAEKLDVEIRFPSKQKGQTIAQGDALIMQGEVEDNQLKLAAELKVVSQDGKIEAQGDKLRISKASSFTVYVAAKTDYKQVYPQYRTGETAEELQERVAFIVKKASIRGYAALKKEHIKDYSERFSRVHLDLGQSVSELPTNKLLNAYKQKTASETERRQLEVLLFQYGRYLLLSSSRENSQLPANLQGVWNNTNTPKWASDYHLNVNLQMNYWPAYAANLTECALPLIAYINALREPGRVTAEMYAGVKSKAGEANGFMAHTQNTPFGWTCPGWVFNWGWSPAAVPWILQNCWEHYEFTGDLAFMRKNIYPMLKEEARLYDQLLVEDGDGKLISSPTFSPEYGPRTAGNTYEQSLIWQLYQDAITAATLVGESDSLINHWKTTQSRLKSPIEIGTDGQVKEWYHETTLGSVSKKSASHRHISHMLGVFPGDLINANNKEWFEAAKVSMHYRTDKTTGWGMGQRINTWARLREGNKAYQLITYLFQKGIYQNLWDTHPPFQIDGNLGYTAGLAEMLVQSNAGYIDILPALPDVWSSGSVRGILARGNFEIAIDWSKSTVQQLELLSNQGNKAIIQLAEISEATVKNQTGKPIDFKAIAPNRISFDTQAGQRYSIQLKPNPSGLAE